MLVEIIKTDSITCSRQAYFLVFLSQSMQIFVGRMFLSSQMIGEGFCFSMAGFFLVKQTNKQTMVSFEPEKGISFGCEDS